MLKKPSRCYLLLVILFSIISLSKAEVIVSDDFEDGVLDSSKWINTGGGTVVEAAGKMTLTSAGTTSRPNVESTVAATIASGETMVLSTSDYDMGDYVKSQTLGLYTSDWNNIINIGINDSTQAYVQMRSAGGSWQSLVIHHGALMEGPTSISWSDGRVIVESGIWGILFDSHVQTVDSTGAAWVVPAVGTNMKVLARTGYGESSMWFEDLKLEKYTFYVEDVIDDPFDSSDLDTLVWDDISVDDGNVSIVDGKLNLLPGGTNFDSNSAGIISKVGFNPGFEQKVVAVFEEVERSAGASSRQIRMSFYNGGNWAQSEAIEMGLNTGSPDYGNMKFSINNQISGFSDYKTIWGVQEFAGTWIMVWEPDRVRVYRYGKIFFDTDVDGGVNGTLPGEWEIPSVDLMLNMTSSWGEPAITVPHTVERIRVVKGDSAAYAINDSFEDSNLNTDFWYDLSEYPGNIQVGTGQIIFDSEWEDTIKRPAGVVSRYEYWASPEVNEPVVVVAENLRDYGDDARNFYLIFPI